MSTEYSADSSKSFMIAMQSMIDTSQTFNLDRSKISLPDFDDELKSPKG